MLEIDYLNFIWRASFDARAPVVHSFRNRFHSATVALIPEALGTRPISGLRP